MDMLCCAVHMGAGQIILSAKPVKRDDRVRIGLDPIDFNPALIIQACRCFVFIP